MGLHLAGLVWGMIDVGSIEEAMRGESLRRTEGNQEQHERDKTVTFGDFIIVLKKVDKKDAAACENDFDKRGEAASPSSTQSPLPSASTSFSPPPRKNEDRLERPSSEPIAQDTESRPPPGVPPAKPVKRV